MLMLNGRCVCACVAEEKTAINGTEASSPGKAPRADAPASAYASKRLLSVVMWSWGRANKVGGEGDGTAAVWLDDTSCDFDDSVDPITGETRW